MLVGRDGRLERPRQKYSARKPPTPDAAAHANKSVAAVLRERDEPPTLETTADCVNRALCPARLDKDGQAFDSPPRPRAGREDRRPNQVRRRHLAARVGRLEGARARKCSPITSTRRCHPAAALSFLLTLTIPPLFLRQINEAKVVAVGPGRRKGANGDLIPMGARTRDLRVKVASSSEPFHHPTS